MRKQLDVSPRRGATIRDATWLSPSADEVPVEPEDALTKRRRLQRERGARLRATAQADALFRLRYESILLPGFQKVINELEASEHTGDTQRPHFDFY